MSPKPINLALQGGGAHGAFTWGVLDCMLEDGRVAIEAISGTSAGAMNAVVMAYGLSQGGVDGARGALSRFWHAVSDAARFSPVRRSPIDVFMGNWTLDSSPGYLAMDLLGRISSPYQLNPLNINPLADILREHVDFTQLRSCDPMKLMVSATNVETGRVKVFHCHELTAEMVMASACLPFLFQAVEIDGVPYWDGGYMGNPVLFPFYGNSHSPDIVIVQINPVERRGTPRTAREILDRVNEITFNASLLKELRSVDFVRRLLDEGALDEQRYRRMHIHLIEDDEVLTELGASSKLNAERAFLEHLFDLGRDAARRWLDRHYEALGKRSTVDTRAMFEGLGPDHRG